MKYRNQFMKYKMFANDAGGEGGTGGGSGGAGEGGQQGGEGGAGNNNQNPLDTFNSLWDTGTQQGGQQQQQPAAQPTQQPAAQPSPEEAFNQHVANINFGGDPNQMVESIRNGEIDGFAKQLQEMQVGIYKAAMLDANKMMRQNMDTLRSELQQQTETTINSDKVISQMEQALPYTKEPAYAPMAKAVLSRLLSKEGMTADEAIKQTGEYFSLMASQVGGAGGGTGNGGAAGNQSGTQTQQEDVDWVSFLGGKPG